MRRATPSSVARPLLPRPRRPKRRRPRPPHRQKTLCWATMRRRLLTTAAASRRRASPSAVSRCSPTWPTPLPPRPRTSRRRRPLLLRPPPRRRSRRRLRPRRWAAVMMRKPAVSLAESRCCPRLELLKRRPHLRRPRRAVAACLAARTTVSPTAMTPTPCSVVAAWRRPRRSLPSRPRRRRNRPPPRRSRPPLRS